MVLTLDVMAGLDGRVCAMRHRDRLSTLGKIRSSGDGSVASDRVVTVTVAIRGGGGGSCVGVVAVAVTMIKEAAVEAAVGW